MSWQVVICETWKVASSMYFVLVTRKFENKIKMWRAENLFSAVCSQLLTQIRWSIQTEHTIAQKSSRTTMLRIDTESLPRLVIQKFSWFWRLFSVHKTFFKIAIFWRFKRADLIILHDIKFYFCLHNVQHWSTTPLHHFSKFVQISSWSYNI